MTVGGVSRCDYVEQHPQRIQLVNWLRLSNQSRDTRPIRQPLRQSARRSARSLIRRPIKNRYAKDVEARRRRRYKRSALSCFLLEYMFSSSPFSRVPSRCLLVALLSLVALLVASVTGAAPAQAQPAPHCTDNPGFNTVTVSQPSVIALECIIPAGVSSVSVTAIGGAGGAGDGGAQGGAGSEVDGSLAVYGGEALYLYPGGNGSASSGFAQNGEGGTTVAGIYGGPSGGSGGDGGSSGAGGGGGASIVAGPSCSNSSCATTITNLLVAGGGGGGGANGFADFSGPVAADAQGGDGGLGGYDANAGAGANGQTGSDTTYPSDTNPMGYTLSGGSGGTGGTLMGAGPGGSGGAVSGTGSAVTITGGSGSDGTGSSGGSGMNDGGGGGGGYFGGGSGGDGAVIIDFLRAPYRTEAAGGGGGGGSSLAPMGGQSSTALELDGPQITLSYTVAGPPSAAITSPNDDQTFATNQTVPTAFSCQDDSNGPGITSCSDSNGADTSTGGNLDTSTPGTFTYTVTATSQDGQSGTTSINYTVAGPPSATISSPDNDQTFATNQTVPTAFSCQDDSNGPGIASCTDSNGADTSTGGNLDTSTPGTFTYTVTATSQDGQSGTTSINYTVAGPPSATISSPANNQTYNINQNVSTAFSCSDDPNGSGISSCTDSNNNSSGTGSLDTSTPGTFTYSVTATSNDGQTNTTSIDYTVAGPPSATISSANNQTYNINQSVSTVFSCSDDPNGSGIASCTDSNGADASTGGNLDTSTPGTFIYSVTATSNDGQTNTTSINYTVAGSPTIALQSGINDENYQTVNDQTYPQNEVVDTDVTCTEGDNGSGLNDCYDSNGAGDTTLSGSPNDDSFSGQLDTTSLGANSYTVTTDSNDGAETTETINYTVVDEPSATIISPTNHQTYTVGQTVATSFACSEADGGPGLASCTDSNGTNADSTTDVGSGNLDTSTPGTHTYTVTATSQDGGARRTSLYYIIVGPPSATINSPNSGGSYSQGQTVATSFSCADDPYGPGIQSCTDNNGSSADSSNQGTGTLDTSTPGSHTYTVNVTSADGQTASASITYQVNPVTTTAPTTTTTPPPATTTPPPTLITAPPVTTTTPPPTSTTPAPTPKPMPKPHPKPAPKPSPKKLVSHTTRLSLRATPTVDPYAPYQYHLTGNIQVPRGQTRAGACRGQVRITIRDHGRVLINRTVTLTSRCQYQLQVTFTGTKTTPLTTVADLEALRTSNRITSQATLVEQGTLSARARYLGTKSIHAVSSHRLTLRYGHQSPAVTG
jgi:hypothetical protein